VNKQRKRVLGLIFNKSQNKFQDPSKLWRLVVDLIDLESRSYCIYIDE